MTSSLTRRSGASSRPSVSRRMPPRRTSMATSAGCSSRSSPKAMRCGSACRTSRRRPSGAMPTSSPPSGQGAIGRCAVGCRHSRLRCTADGPENPFQPCPGRQHVPELLPGSAVSNAAGFGGILKPLLKSPPPQGRAEPEGLHGRGAPALFLSTAYRDGTSARATTGCPAGLFTGADRANSASFTWATCAGKAMLGH